jgi:biotin carboxyl carrier protein
MKTYRLRIDQRTYQVEVGDIYARPVLVTVDGVLFEIWPEEAQPALQAPAAPNPAPAARREAPPPPPAVEASGKLVKAPIPGVIVEVSVKPGEAVEAGQQLLVLEAMKMKNAIRSARAGTVAALHVSLGEHVRHQQPLVEFSE